MLLAYTIISTFLNVLNGINVYMNDNITASIGEDGIKITCSFTKEDVNSIFAVALFSRNRTTYSNFTSIVTFVPDKSTSINPSGEHLRGRIKMTNITQNSTEATMIFNELKCTDQNQYRCKVTYLNTNIEVNSEMSLPTTITIINVTAKPQTPHISSNVIQQNHNIEKRSILQSEVINRSSIYQATNVTDHDTSSIPIPREGDNVTLVCNGNVGRPPGKIMWQIFHMNETILFKVTETNQTEPSPWKCSFNRTSYLTFQLSAVDFNAKIRCFVVSHDGNNENYVATAPLKFHFGVRHASINKLPDKQTYDTTIKNITLMCNADGNPKPAYTWYRKKNNNTILSTSYRYVITNVIQNNSGTYICEVNNTISGDMYNDSTSVEITIENINDSSEDKINSSEMNIGIVIGMTGFGGCVIAVISLAFFRYRKRQRHRKRKRFHEGNETPSSKTFSENCSMFNPAYTSDLGFNVGGNINDFGKAMDSRKNKLENEEKINRIPSTASSKYAKENMDNILKYQSKNTCDNSLDHYASSVPDVYDELHDNRHKRDKVEPFDTMIELTNLAENRNASRGGYESVVLDGDKSVISLENNAYGHDDPRTIIQHNEEYMHNQKQEGRKINKSPIPNQTVEYAQVNEAMKLKYKTKSNDTDQTTVAESASSQEGIHGKFEERPPELTDHTDTQENQQTNGDPEPSLKYNQTEPHTNQTFDNEEYPKIDSVSMNDIQDEGQVDQNSEQQSSNDYEKVQIEQNQ